MSTCKFRIGDEVIGNELANKYYGITTKGWRGIVDGILDDGRISVRSHRHPDDKFSVEQDCFDLYVQEVIPEHVFPSTKELPDVSVLFSDGGDCE